MSRGVCEGPFLHSLGAASLLLLLLFLPVLFMQLSCSPGTQCRSPQFPKPLHSGPWDLGERPSPSGEWMQGQGPGGWCGGKGRRALSAQIVFAGIEVCLGRTDKVKSGSDGQ